MKESLRAIGLTDGEIRVYLALLDIGSSSSGKITKKSGISGSKVYEVLDRLMAKGLVTNVVKNGVRFFEAASPERILDYLEQKKESIDEERVAIQNILPSLMMKRVSTPKSEAKIFMGWEGMKTANEEIIQSLKRGEEWLSMGLSSQPKHWENYFNSRQVIRAKKGIVHRQLLNVKYKSLYRIRRKLPHTEYRFLSGEMEMPATTEIYGDSVAFFVLVKESPLVFQIKNAHVAASFQKHFELLWKQAKRP